MASRSFFWLIPDLRRGWCPVVVGGNVRLAFIAKRKPIWRKTRSAILCQILYNCRPKSVDPLRPVRPAGRQTFTTSGDERFCQISNEFAIDFVQHAHVANPKRSRLSSAVIMDGQSIKPTEGRGARGFDNH